MRRLIRLSENDLHKIVKRSVRRALRESFEDDYNAARDNHMNHGGMWGMEYKNGEGDWEYGEVTFDPNSMTMSCNGITSDVDPDRSVDENLQALYQKITEKYPDQD